MVWDWVLDDFEAAIARLHANDPALTHLVCWNWMLSWGLEDQDILRLASVLPYSTHITTIDLTNNFLTSAGIQTLFTFAILSPSLAYIILTNNRFTGEEIPSLGALLSGSRVRVIWT
eukprot:m.187783 g.187783  ORF g.187783 m.187783 type:complete len:117 (+) comp53582_c0_seq4:122-472(+)